MTFAAANLPSHAASASVQPKKSVSVEGTSLDLSFSPDGAEVVAPWPIAAGKVLLVTAAVDGSRRRVMPGTDGAESPAWSTNGKYILFSAPSQDHSTSLKILTLQDHTTADLEPDVTGPLLWRTDNLRVAGVRHVGSAAHVYLYDRQGRGTMMDVPLPNAQVVQTNDEGAWIPNTDSVGVIASGNVYLEQVGQIKQITTTGDVVGLGISPDGKGLIWARAEKSFPSPRLSLFTFDASTASIARAPFDDADLRKQFSDRAGVVFRAVCFSKDAARMALVVTDTGSRRPTKAEFAAKSVFLLSVPHPSATPLTSPERATEPQKPAPEESAPGDAAPPTSSPPAVATPKRAAAFSSDSVDSSLAIQSTLAVSDSGSKARAHHAAAHRTAASPKANAEVPPPSNALRVVSLQTPIAQPDANAPAPRLPETDLNPVFSPDGTRLAIFAQESGGRSIRVYNLHGQGMLVMPRPKPPKKSSADALDSKKPDGTMSKAQRSSHQGRHR